MVIQSTDNSPVIALPLFSLFAFIIVFPFSKTKGIIEELKPKLISRSIIFSVAQCFVIKALENRSTFSTFSSIALGTILAITLGKFFLRETITKTSFFGIILTFFGVFLLKKDFSMPYLALVAGILQGTGVFLTKKRSVAGASIPDMASANLLTLLVISTPLTMVTLLDANSPKPTLHWFIVLLVGVGFAALQTSYNYLSKNIDSWMLSLVGNSRIPASILVASIFYTEPFSWKKMGVGAIVFSGLAIAYYGMRAVKNQTIR